MFVVVPFLIFRDIMTMMGLESVERYSLLLQRPQHHQAIAISQRHVSNRMHECPMVYFTWVSKASQSPGCLFLLLIVVWSFVAVVVLGC